MSPECGHRWSGPGCCPRQSRTQWPPTLAVAPRFQKSNYAPVSDMASLSLSLSEVPFSPAQASCLAEKHYANPACAHSLGSCSDWSYLKLRACKFHPLART